MGSAKLLMASWQSSAGPEDQPFAMLAHRPAKPKAATATAQSAGDASDIFPPGRSTLQHQPQNSNALLLLFDFQFKHSP